MENKKSKGIDLSGTHIPVLTKLLSVTKGSVLELGAGYNSTPLLYWTCKAEDRYFASYENHKDWCEKIGDLTRYIEDWNKLSIDSVYWDIAFIDLRPALERHRQAIRLKDNARFVVLHDSEPEIDRFYAYRRVWRHFEYRYDYTLLKPNTSIVSNFEDPAKYFPLDNG
jgi:hypothetical protein